MMLSVGDNSWKPVGAGVYVLLPFIFQKFSQRNERRPLPKLHYIPSIIFLRKIIFSKHD